MGEQSHKGKLIESYIREHLEELNREDKPLGVKTLSRNFLKNVLGVNKPTEKEVDAIRSIVRGYLGRSGSATVKQRFHIRNRNTSETQPVQFVNTPYRQANVLVFDIETSPLMVYTWGIWNQNIPTDNILKDWMILTWSAKWLFEDKMYSARIKPSEIKRNDDKRVVKALWSLIDEADIVIAHNGNKFDIKRMNTRFLKHGLNLPSPYQSIDTLLHARKKFNIISNRLDYIASNFLGIEGKMETEKGLWKKAIEGDREALHTMDVYCQQDVRVLEDVYLHLRPYIQPHPNIGLLESSDKPQCPCCGSTDLKPIGDYNTYVNTYMSFRCPNGSISRSRVNATPKSVRDNLNVSTP